ncbi:hypothetical protein [Thioalkalivibrio sp. XN8]|uniref:hypothetical protein n=1 Tax=Thioalkalivibrio sp. XN8 TaxID=2712863 RepID=UPI0013EA6D0B|nr:hypothetical protein [Thioalkalivibrio sp. XN8]NGP53499.1 hypothetical protein [Thioalkalivibrio sp. XN8]
MKTLYSHKQPGTTMLWLVGAIVVGLLVVLGPVAAHPALLVVFGVLVAIAVVFSSLSVQITASSLLFWFGPGVLRKQVPLAEIANVEVVRNPWYWGLGWRITPRGMLYSVSGLDAVEITLRDGSRFRLGTDQPERLARALDSARERFK